MFDNLRKDFRQHGSSLLEPAFWTLAVYRYGRWTLQLRPRWLGRILGKLYGVSFRFNEALTGNNLHREVEIGEDFHMVHSGNIRIHPYSVIGDRVGIMHHVTFGTNMERAGAPIIGNDVFVGCGSSILGDVTIGDGVRIAANTLVITDVPAGATAIGVPARIIRYTGRKATKPQTEPEGPAATSDDAARRNEDVDAALQTS